MNNAKYKQKTPAGNGFGASGGVGPSEKEQVTSFFALVQTFAIPACRQAAGTLSASGVQR
jgi:hypothetical protein